VRRGPQWHYEGEGQRRPRRPPTLPLHRAVLASGSLINGQHCKYGRPKMADGFDEAAVENVRVLASADPRSCTVRSGMAEAWPLHFAFEYAAPQVVKDSLCAATPVDAFGNPKRREAGTWGASKSSGGDLAKLRRETRQAASLRYLVAQGGAGTPASALLAKEEAERAKEADLEARLATGKAELEGAIDAPRVQLMLGSVPCGLATPVQVQTAEEFRRALCAAKQLNVEWWNAPSTQRNSQSTYSRASRIPRELFQRADEVRRILDARAGLQREREPPRVDDLSDDDAGDDQAWQTESDPDEYEWW